MFDVLAVGEVLAAAAVVGDDVVSTLEESLQGETNKSSSRKNIDMMIRMIHIPTSFHDLITW